MKKFNFMEEADWEQLYEAFDFLEIIVELKRTLLGRKKMVMALFEFQFEDEDLDYLKRSLKEDGDEYLFAITENRGDIAMVLIESNGKVYKNEEAKKRLKKLWKDAYKQNIMRMLPIFAEQLFAGELATTAVKSVKSIERASVIEFPRPKTK